MPIDLFGEDMPYSERLRSKKTGYPYPPGTGPKDETCRSCKFLYRHEMSRVYLKCWKMKRDWTHGSGTDIKARSPACKLWEKKETDA